MSVETQDSREGQGGREQEGKTTSFSKKCKLLVALCSKRLFVGQPKGFIIF